MDKIKTFIESDIYNSVLNKVEDSLRIEVNKKTPPITMLKKIQEYCIFQIINKIRMNKG